MWCLCVCLLFFGHSFAWNENTNFLISCSLTTQKRKRSIQLLKGKLVTLNKKTFFIAEHVISLSLLKFEKRSQKISSATASLRRPSGLENGVWTSSVQTRSRGGQRGKEGGGCRKLWKILTFLPTHNSISIFHPQSIIKKVEHELEKDVNLVAEKTHMKPWWVKNKLKTLRQVKLHRKSCLHESLGNK